MLEGKELELEKKYLSKTLKVVRENIKTYNNKLKNAKEEFKETKQYLSSEYHNIDAEEIDSINETLRQICFRIDFASNLLSRGERQKLSPYFAKIKFKIDNEQDAEDYYIGLFNLFNENQYPLVCDWRAPISSLYYDFQCGKAHFTAPQGLVEGELLNKRQFKIEDGKLKLCFDTDMTIQDDILMQTLGQTTSSQMRNIVATIQKEQNDIIREDIYKSLLVQGVAGSGKTSIALHRIAYLIYNNRDTLSSKEITILSPNKIFSNYISSVLPQLGEENVNQLTFEEIANSQLNGYVKKLESRESMISDILTNENRKKSVQIKSSFQFYDKLKQYIKSYFNLEFEASDIVLADERVPKEVINNLYHNLYKEKTPAIRIEWITDYILERINISRNNDEIAKRIKKVLYPMFTNIDIVEIYRDFCQSENIEFNYDKNVPYEDISPLLYIKNYILGIEKQHNVKYLVIDEMQDYSPIFMDIICEIFDCYKLIVGDIYQTIEKELDESYLDRLALLTNCQLKTLDRSYRSSYEIVSEEEKLIGKKMNKIKRYAGEVKKHSLKHKDEICAYIDAYYREFDKYKQVAIITKDEEEANNLINLLEEKNKFNLITSKNQTIEKYNIVPLVYAKGLEFDACIIYNFNYKKNTYKMLKYIAISRALHELVIIN